mmetsp:Transcript_15067/g.45161  ORF Transcript_15067/g.45161 Transcript_15067/m.45161 type:complete len:596 (-) Transcript_15067:6-1793(-)
MPPHAHKQGGGESKEHLRAFARQCMASLPPPKRAGSPPRCEPPAWIRNRRRAQHRASKARSRGALGSEQTRRGTGRQPLNRFRSQVSSLECPLPELPQLFDERDDVLALLRVRPNGLLRVRVELDGVGLHGLLGVAASAELHVFLGLEPQAHCFGLLLVLLGELPRRHVLEVVLLPLLLVEDLAPLAQELGGLGVLRAVALALHRLACDLGRAALLDVLVPPPVRLLLRKALRLVGRVLLLDLVLHALFLVVLHRSQRLGLVLDHQVARRLLRSEDFVLLLLAKHEHLRLPVRVLLDLVVLALQAQGVLRLDLLEVLVGLLRLPEGLDGLAAPALLGHLLARHVLVRLAAQELALEHTILDLAVPLLLVLGKLLLLSLRDDLVELLLGLLLLHLALEHLSVVLLLHLHEAVLANLLELLELALELHLRLALREDVAVHHLAVEGLHAVGLVVEDLVGALDRGLARVELDLRLLGVDLLPLELERVHLRFLHLRLLPPATLQRVVPLGGLRLRDLLEGLRLLPGIQLRPARLQAAGASEGLLRHGIAEAYACPDAIEVGRADHDRRCLHRHQPPRKEAPLRPSGGRGLGWVQVSDP